jgi:hypothetical protein
MALTLSGTASGIIDGTKPWREYSNTTSESPDIGTGLKKPVSALLRGCIRRPARSYR